MDEQSLPQLANYQSTAILKELSDIKANLAVNSNETKNIKESVTDLRADVKDLKLNVADRVAALETEKSNKVEVDKTTGILFERYDQVEARTRKLEDWRIWVVAYAAGGGAVAFFILNYVVPYFKPHT